MAEGKSESESDIPRLCFDKNYYDEKYFADPAGKKFKRPDGTIDTFGYRNPQAEWLGCAPIANTWKSMFNPRNMLDVGCGRGTFLTYARDAGIEAVGFDFSDFGVGRPYVRCNPGWIFKHDATQRYPYADNHFDFVTVLDLMEHLYEDDIDKVLSEVHRVCDRYVFFLIATIGGGSGLNALIHDCGYILKRGEPVPVQYEGMAAAGHVTVCSREWWEQKLLDKEKGYKWVIRRDLEEEFRRRVPADVLANWKTIIILEKTKE